MSDRHGIHPTCPNCGHNGVAQLRRYFEGRMKAVRGWRRCQKCPYEFTVQQGRAETIRRTVRYSRAT